MPNGQGIEKFDALLVEMLANGWQTIDHAQMRQYKAMICKLGQHFPPPLIPTEVMEAMRITRPRLAVRPLDPQRAGQ